MNNGNLVYKTYDISTNIEYINGTRLNLSGVRIIKLVNRPAGVQVWISTDSNGTNLFPLINRGDGWDLPQDMEPLYDLYVFTKGVNSQDKLILTYTGEKNFFVFGSNSIEKVGEIEALGEQAQININNAIMNTYSRLPLDNMGFVFQKNFCADIEYSNVTTTPQAVRLLSFPLNDSGLISDFNFDDDSFYRLSVFGHIDVGASKQGYDTTGNSALTETCHLSLFNNSEGAEWTVESDQEVENLFRLNKRPYNALTKFDIFGLKYVQDNGQYGYMSGDSNVKFDIILQGKTINQYKYLGLFFTYYVYTGAGWVTFPNLHCSLLFVISQAISNMQNVNINQLPTERNQWIGTGEISLKYHSDDKKRADYVIERYKKIGVTNKTFTTEQNLPNIKTLFDGLVEIVKTSGDHTTEKNLLNTYALTVYQYYREWKRLEYLQPVITSEIEKQRIEQAKQTIVTNGSNTNNYTNDWYWCNDPMGLIEFLKELGIIVDISKV